jgi:hypothetical protein
MMYLMILILYFAFNEFRKNFFKHCMVLLFKNNERLILLEREVVMFLSPTPFHR